MAVYLGRELGLERLQLLAQRRHLPLRLLRLLLRRQPHRLPIQQLLRHGLGLGLGRRRGLLRRGVRRRPRRLGFARLGRGFLHALRLRRRLFGRLFRGAQLGLQPLLGGVRGAGLRFPLLSRLVRGAQLLLERRHRALPLLDLGAAVARRRGRRGLAQRHNLGVELGLRHGLALHHGGDLVELRRDPRLLVLQPVLGVLQRVDALHQRRQLRGALVQLRLQRRAVVAAARAAALQRRRQRIAAVRGGGGLDECARAAE